MQHPWAQLRSRLMRYVRSMTRSSEDAEDVAQEAIVRVLEAGSKGEIHYHNAYLYRTARNLTLNSLTRKSAQLEVSMEEILGSDVFVSEEGSLDEQVDSQRQFELFCQAVAELPDQCRQVLVLRKVYGYSQQEVASRLGISVSTVDKHLAKGLVRCSRYVESHSSLSTSRKPGSTTGLGRVTR